jgi:hypothetical protein
MKLAKILTVVSLVGLAAAPAAQAQFGNLLKKDGAAAGVAVSSADFSSLLEATTGNVLAARIQFLDAQAELSSALGLNTESLVKASEALRAVEGASSNPGAKVKALKDSSKKTEGAKKEFSAALAKSDSLSAESKEKFAKGTVKFLQGVMMEKEQIDAVMKLVEQGKALSSSAGMTEKVKVLGMIKPAIELASLVPGDVKEGLTTFRQITSFAKGQSIPVPTSGEATDKLGEGP